MVLDIQEFFVKYAKTEELRECVEAIAEQEGFAFDLEFDFWELEKLYESDFYDVYFGMGEIFPCKMYYGGAIVLIRSTEVYKELWLFLQDVRR